MAQLCPSLVGNDERRVPLGDGLQLASDDDKIAFADKQPRVVG